MKIGIDILGGDFAPDAALKGACLAYAEIPSGVKIVLIGDQEQIKSSLATMDLMEVLCKGSQCAMSF